MKMMSKLGSSDQTQSKAATAAELKPSFLETKSGKYTFRSDHRVDIDDDIEIEMQSPSPMDDVNSSSGGLVSAPVIHTSSGKPVSTGNALEKKALISGKTSSSSHGGSGGQRVNDTPYSTHTANGSTHSIHDSTHNDNNKKDDDDEDGSRKLQITLTSFQVTFYFTSVVINLIASIMLLPTVNDVVLSGILFAICSIGFLFSDGIEMWKQLQYPSITHETEHEEKMLIFNAISTSERFSFKRTLTHQNGLSSRNNSHKYGFKVNSNTSGSGASGKSKKVKRMMQSSVPEITSPFLTPTLPASPIPSVTEDGGVVIHEPTDEAMRTRSGSKWSLTLSNPVTLTKTMARISVISSILLLIGSVMFIYDRTVMYGVKITIVSSLLFLGLSLVRIYEAGCHCDEDDLSEGEMKSTATMHQVKSTRSTATTIKNQLSGRRTAVTDDYFTGDSVHTNQVTVVQNSNNKQEIVGKKKMFAWKNLWSDWVTVSIDVLVAFGSFMDVIGCIFYLPYFTYSSRLYYVASVLFVIGGVAYMISGIIMGYQWYTCNN
jgi:hypothetical protein